jgi:heptosyltransferase-2
MAHIRRPGAGKRLLATALNALAGNSRSGGMPRELRQDDVRSILVLELWNIGDVILAIPFLRRLREIFPRARVTLVARPHARVILEGTGLVDDFIDDASRADNWLSLNPFAGSWGDLWRIRRQLRARNFDLAFQSRLHVREHVILAMSGAARRFGYSFIEDDRMLTDPLPIDDLHRHKVADWLRLLEPFGATAAMATPLLHISDVEREAAAQFLSQNGVVAADTVIGIHPGASVSEKRWPLNRFKEVARQLASRPGCRVLAFVDPAGYGTSLGEIDGVIAARTNLRELMALIERCQLIVCNDSGPMHIAGALGIPTVALFGNGIAKWFAPLGDGHELVSSDRAGSSGLEDIPASRVMEALARVASPKAASAAEAS